MKIEERTLGNWRAPLLIARQNPNRRPGLFYEARPSSVDMRLAIA